MQLGPLTEDVTAATAEALDLVPRIWDRDHTVWGHEPTEIADRLGWLDAPERADEVIEQLERDAASVLADGVTDVLLVGMGGSSLYPEVLTTTYGTRPGAARLHVLDSTDPGAVLAMEQQLPWSATLLVPASKSGTTIETMSHLARFLDRLTDAHGDSAGRFVTPITDPGSQLDARAKEDGFRLAVHGQSDVGGRFSALTPFGLWPAALLGLDLREHLAPARDQLASARSGDASVNSSAVLGAIMAVAARSGRDKLTLLLPDEIASLGLWIEQLVAESTGKHGVGLLPVLGETAANATFGDDRVVVAVGEHEGAADLVAAGVPVVQLPWDGIHELTREVVRWEFATAIAGALLGINPFDQPNVASAKAATSAVLETGTDLPEPAPVASLLSTIQPGDYIGLLAFVEPGSEDEQVVRAAAQALRASTGVPVTVGIGPRYLHSTGQLHKGGPNNGVFLIAVGDDPHDAQIPGEEVTFSRLKRAQAAGDLQALTDADRRAQLVSLQDLASL